MEEERPFGHVDSEPGFSYLPLKLPPIKRGYRISSVLVHIVFHLKPTPHIASSPFIYLLLIRAHNRTFTYVYINRYELFHTIHSDPSIELSFLMYNY